MFLHEKHALYEAWQQGLSMRELDKELLTADTGQQILYFIPCLFTAPPKGRVDAPSIYPTIITAFFTHYGHRAVDKVHPPV